MTEQEEDSILSELITDLYNKISKENLKSIIDPIFNFAQEYIKIYVYVIYVIIIILLILNTLNLFLTIRIHNRIFS